MVICNDCGSPLNSSSTKCQVCGKSQVSSNSNQPNPGGYCGKCGTPLAAKYSPCPNCGHVKTTFASVPTPQPGAMPSPSYKGTGTCVALALVLGFFGLCGVGHFYINKIERGIVLLIIGIILGVIAWVSMGIGLVAFIPFLAWTVYDAHKWIKYYNSYMASHHKSPW
tara:strand:- start:4680 stop:5180 length:501 start_codon:yes stop_codon:yes gene_type:complete